MSKPKKINTKPAETGAKGKISRRELLKMLSPLGAVEMMGDGCTGCGLCALECPTGALRLSVNEDDATCQLLFRHSACPACGECVAACPEGCLRLVRDLEPGKFNLPPVVLFTDTIIRCAACGKPVASRAMIESIKKKIGADGGTSPTRVELCPECKIGLQFSSLRA